MGQRVSTERRLHPRSTRPSSIRPTKRFQTPTTTKTAVSSETCRPNYNNSMRQSSSSSSVNSAGSSTGASRTTTEASTMSGLTTSDMHSSSSASQSSPTVTCRSTKRSQWLSRRGTRRTSECESETSKGACLIRRGGRTTSESETASGLPPSITATGISRNSVGDSTSDCIALRERLNKIEDYLELQYGLMTHLVSRGVLTDRQKGDIQRPGSSLYEQVDRLIDLLSQVLTDEENRHQFLLSLRETGQGHLSKYIIGGGTELSNEHRVLTVTERERIRRNSSFLVENIDPEHGLLDRLYSTGVLSTLQLQSIGSNRTEYAKNQELLDILKRRSYKQYCSFITCLKAMKQEHIAEVMESNGIVASMDAVLEPTNGGATVEERQKRIMNEFRHLPPEERRKMLASLQESELVGISQSHSIRLYFLCPTLETLKALRLRCDGGQMKQKIKDLFHKLLSKEVDFVSVVPQHVYLVDFCKCQQFFIDCSQGVSSEELHLSRDKMENVPIEIREAVLFKSFLLMYSNLCGTIMKPTEIVYNTLMSIHSTWRKLAKSKMWFRMLRKELRKIDSTRFRLELFAELNALSSDCREVYGVTMLKNKIFIVCASYKVIVFTIDNFNSRGNMTRLDDIEIKGEGMKKIFLTDIAGCSTTNCLYAYDHNDIIWKLSDAGEKYIQIRWLNRKVSGVMTMSVTSYGNVLLCDSCPPRIYIYAPDSRLINKINLPLSIEHPRHVLELPSGNYIVSHGVACDPLHRVLEITKYGHTTRSYGCRPGGLDGQLNEPVHVAVDLEGNVFVADYFNERVLVLDSTLSLCEVCEYGEEGRRGGCRPWGLSYSLESQLLLVGMQNGLVHVYKGPKVSL